MADLSAGVTRRMAALWTLYETLMADVNSCWDRVNDEPSEFYRRTAVRSTFAFIEGVTFALKQVVLEWLRDNWGMSPWRFLKPEEMGRLVLLAEKDYRLNDKGGIEIRSARLDLPGNLLFTFNTFFDVINKKKSPIDTSGPGWSEFKEAIKIRNRLTHPKVQADVSISPEEVLLVHRVFQWFHDLFRAAFGRESTTGTA